ncbi:MAG: hypothetical protein HY556_11435 [Euryarchaeota archaeon]|nr:hypothetical protein [Euryarchaeota archaeon]
MSQRILLVILILMPFAAVALPGVHAQSMTSCNVRLGDLGAGLVPNRVQAMKVAVDYIFSPGSAPGVDQGRQAPARSIARLEVVSQPEWLNYTIHNVTLAFDVEARNVFGNSKTNETDMFLNASLRAPALVRGAITVRASFEANGNMPTTQCEATKEDVIPLFISKLAFQGPQGQSIPSRGGLPIIVPFTLMNLGNSPVEVRFRLTTSPEFSIITLPPRLTLESLADGATNTRDLQVEIRTPWSTDEGGTVEIQAESLHPTRPDLIGDKPKFSFQLAGKNVVPGLEPWFLAVLACAALVARRRTR